VLFRSSFSKKPPVAWRTPSTTSAAHPVWSSGCCGCSEAWMFQIRTSKSKRSAVTISALKIQGVRRLRCYHDRAFHERVDRAIVGIRAHRREGELKGRARRHESRVEEAAPVARDGVRDSVLVHPGNGLPDLHRAVRVGADRTA